MNYIQRITWLSYVYNPQLGEEVVSHIADHCQADKLVSDVRSFSEKYSWLALEDELIYMYEIDDIKHFIYVRDMGSVFFNGDDVGWIYNDGVQLKLKLTRPLEVGGYRVVSGDLSISNEEIRLKVDLEGESSELIMHRYFCPESLQCPDYDSADLMSTVTSRTLLGKVGRIKNA